jgi:hypothetical protein
VPLDHAHRLCDPVWGRDQVHGAGFAPNPPVTHCGGSAYDQGSGVGELTLQGDQPPEDLFGILGRHF